MIQLRANNSEVGWSKWSPTGSFTTQPGTPNTVTNITANSVTATSVTLAYLTPANISGAITTYLISGLPCSTCSYSVGANVTSIPFEGLTPGKYYVPIYVTFF